MTPLLFDQPRTVNTMTLMGQGQVTTDPNVTNIHLGVQTTGSDLTTTQTENSQISQSVLLALKQLGVSSIKTVQYAIDTIYDYENGTRIDKGYSVRNTLEIKTTKMDQVGLLIDTAVTNGANFVEFVLFEVSDSDILYQQALNLALKNAVQKAQSLAYQLGLSAPPVPIHITENSVLPISTPFINAVQERVFTTPIEPGHTQIKAQVTVEFTYY